MDVVKEKMSYFADAVNKYGQLNALASGLKFLYTDLKEQIGRKRREQDDSEHYHLVIISHGGIYSSPDPLVIMTSGWIKDIIFYSPWGCGVDGSVVHGIATGTINPSGCSFHVNDVPRDISLLDWNYMSRASSLVVPYVQLQALRQAKCNGHTWRSGKPW